MTGPDGNATYGYDPVGNRTSKVAGATTSYTYDRADGILTAGATSFSVNANGNTTAKGADTFIYDQPNRLKTATVSGTAETYAYDGDGTRFSRQIGSGSPIRYVSDVNRGLPVAVDDGTRKYVYGLGLAYAVNGSSLEVYHTDRLGSIRALTDATGSVSATYRTDEWGTVTAQTGSSTQPFGFTGEPRDATGLTYLRARYYDPALGRFLSRDPWPGTPSSCQTLNRYVYGGNNPATFGDERPEVAGVGGRWHRLVGRSSMRPNPDSRGRGRRGSRRLRSRRGSRLHLRDRWSGGAIWWSQRRRRRIRRRVGIE